MRITGVVKWFDVRTGRGLIARTDGRADCVLRQRDMRGTGLRIVAAGDAVAFDVVDGPDGPLAHNVTRVMAHVPGFGPDVAQHASCS